jgi:hypothetical protein
MMLPLRIKVLSPHGKIEDIEIRHSSEPPWVMTFSGIGLRDQSFAGEDLFDALMALRIRLEDMGYRLLCAGARRDVFPSGMARAMGGGRKAYVLILGEPAVVLVDIFAEVEAEQVGTVAEQQEHYQKWVLR